MFEKVKEHWIKCTAAEKILSIVAPILLLVIVVAEIFLFFEVLATDVLRAVVKAALSVGWALIGLVLWKKFRLPSVCCFGIAMVNVAHTVLLLFR